MILLLKNIDAVETFDLPAVALSWCFVTDASATTVARSTTCLQMLRRMMLKRVDQKIPPPIPPRPPPRPPPPTSKLRLRSMDCGRCCHPSLTPLGKNTVRKAGKQLWVWTGSTLLRCRRRTKQQTCLEHLERSWMTVSFFCATERMFRVLLAR